MREGTRVWISLRPRKRGTAYRLRWQDPASGTWRSKTVGTDRKLAEREAARLEDQLERGTYQHVRRIRWAEFVADHVAKIEGDRNATEAGRTLREFGSMMQPSGPRAVTYPMIESYVVRLAEAGNKPATVNKKLRYIRSALNRAVKRGFAASNPVDGELFKTVENRLPRIATEAEKTAILDAADTLHGFRMRTFVCAALNTGGRRGELLSLPWSRVHLDGDDPYVHFAKTKSHHDRIVPINEDLIEKLHRLKMQTLREGGPFLGMGDNLGRQWGRIVTKSGVSAIRLHDLRATFVTRLIRAEVPLPTVQKLAGHANIQTTIRFYNWVSRDDLRAGIKKLKRDVG